MTMSGDTTSVAMVDDAHCFGAVAYHAHNDASQRARALAK